MRKLALLLIAFAPLSAQDTTLAENFELVGVWDRAGMAKVTFTGSVADWRLAWGTDCSSFPYYVEYGDSASQVASAFAGAAPGSTICLRPEVDTDGNGTFSTAYDCSTDSGIDLTPRIGGGSAECVDGVIEVTMDDDLGFTPTAPSGITDHTALVASSREWTVAACTNAALVSALQSCINDTNNDTGDYDTVKIPHTCTGDDAISLDIPRIYSWPNPDGCAIQSTRTGTSYCPPEGVQPDPGFIGECLPELRIVDRGVETSIPPSVAGKLWIIRDVALLDLDPCSSAIGEGGCIISSSDDSGDKLVTTNQAHNLTTGEGHGDVVLAYARDSNGDWSSANGVYDYETVDSDTLRLIGAAGIEIEGDDAFITQDTPTTSIGWARVFAGELIFERVVFDCVFPCRTARLVGMMPNGRLQVHDSWVRYGNWAILVGGTTPNGGSTYSLANAVAYGFDLGQSDYSSFSNINSMGGGLHLFGQDAEGSTSATNILAQGIRAFYPDTIRDASDDSEDDGVEGVVYPCRNHAITELKSGSIFDFRGFLAANFPKCAEAGNTMPDVIVLRNFSHSDNEQNGTAQGFIRSLVAYNMSAAITIEGKVNSRTESVRMDGTFNISNVLGNQLGPQTETAESAQETAGVLLRLEGAGRGVKFSNWTLYKPWGRYGAFFLNDTVWGGVQIEDGIIAGVQNNEDDGNNAIFSGSGFSTNQNPDFTDQPAGDAFAACCGVTTEDASGTADSYFRDIVITPGCYSSALCDTSTATGNAGSAWTSAGLTAQCSTGTSNYDIPDCQIQANDSLSIDANIAALDLGLHFEYSGSGAGSGDEGFDFDQFAQDAGLITAYTGNTHEIELTATATTLTASLKAHSTAVSCYLDTRPVEGSEWTRVTDSTAARDRQIAATGLTAGTQYKVRVACQEAGPFMRTQAAPGGSS